MNLAISTDDKLIDVAVQEIESYHNNLSEVIKELEVTDNESLGFAADLLKSLKDAEKKIDAAEKEFTGPLNETLKRIRDVFKPRKEALKEMKRILESEKIIPYQKEQERIKREAIEAERKIQAEKIRREQEEKEKQALLNSENKIASEKLLNDAVKLEEKADKVESRPVNVSTQIKTESTAMNIRKTWTYEIVNEWEVPREYCEPSRSIINNAVKQGIREIPGVRIFQNESVVSR